LNARAAFASCTQIDHAKKDDRKSQETTGVKTKNFAFSMFLDQIKLASI
jgi:hypothetical protein